MNPQEELAGEEAPKPHTCSDPNCGHHSHHQHEHELDSENAHEDVGATFGAGRREMSTSGESERPINLLPV